MSSLTTAILRAGNFVIREPPSLIQDRRSARSRCGNSTPRNTQNLRLPL